MSVKQYPFYIKSTVILFGITLLSYALFNLKSIFSPLAFAIIIAILLNPLVNRVQKKKVPHVLAISLAILTAIVVLGGVLYFLATQVSRFSETIPMLKEKFNSLSVVFQNWLQSDFGIPKEKQLKTITDISKNGQAYLTTALGDILGTFGLILLVPVYVFMLLLYKPLILSFLYNVFSVEHSDKVAEILSQTKMAIQSYMVGLLLEAMVVATMNSIALLLLNVQYAILLGVLGAILNVLPYVGGIIAIALPVAMATVTSDGYSTQLGVVGAYMLIQFIDNNILVPRIVSSKVQINALVSIVVVLLGGALWGIAGMFLSIPTIAILKIIFDRVNELKPWGKLLGDEIPTVKKRFWKRRKKESVSEDMVEKST